VREPEHPFIVFLFLMILVTIGKAVLNAIDNSSSLLYTYFLMGVLAVLVLIGLRILDLI